MKLSFYSLFIVILFFSCSSREAKEGVVFTSPETTIIKPSFSKNIVDIYPNLDTIKYIKLELTESSIVAEITKLEVYDSLIYILDAKTSSLFVFNMDGKYQYKIHSLGQGPKEYTQLDFFSIDRDQKQIVLTDLIDYWILRYDLNGKFISRQKIPFWTEGVIPIENKGIVLYANFRDNSKHLKKEYNIIYLDSLNRIQNVYFPYKSSLIGRAKFTTPQSSVFYPYNNRHNFFNSYSDTVYQVEPTGLVVKYIFDLKGKSFDQTYFTQKNNELSDYVKRQEYYSILNILENDEWLYFCISYYSKFEFWHGFYSKKTGELINSEFFYNKKQCFIPNNLATYNSWFISDLPINCLLNIKEQNLMKPIGGMAENELRNLLNSLSEDDNPVLMMYKLKSH